MSALIDSNPDYAIVKIIRVDWSKFKKTDVVKELDIPRRSTLVMFKEGKEIARVVAQTGKQEIEEMFKMAI